MATFSSKTLITKEIQQLSHMHIVPKLATQLPPPRRHCQGNGHVQASKQELFLTFLKMKEIGSQLLFIGATTG